MTYNYSIIIPHRNIPDLIKICLESIPMREDVEVIVVDDCSDRDKCDFSGNCWSNSQNIHFIYTTKGYGAGYARNIGINHAKGKWLLFADADDYYCNGFLEYLDLFRDSSVDVVYFNSKVSGITNVAPFIFRELNTITRYKQGKVTKIELALSYMAAWNKMVRREFLLEHNIRFEQIPVSNDCMFSTLVALKQRSFEVSEEDLYCYVIRHDSLATSNTIENINIRLDTFLRVNRMLVENGYAKYRISLLRFVYYATLIGVPETLQVIRQIIRSDTPLFVSFRREVIPKLKIYLTRKIKTQ